ncbi:MAG: outer membrane beta-barrel protein [Bacteroidales bacterium]|jgi:hypothetical protein|nr:outer membrane beta-barrel protein [Bacteroidales bacterium]
MKNAYMVWLMLMIPFIAAQAREKETSRLRAGIEIGFAGIFGEIKLSDRMRESKSAFPLDGAHCGLPETNQAINGFRTGVKAEYFTRNNRIGLATGLLFEQYSAAVHANGDYFFWQLHQEGLNTYYIRIKNMAQKNFYLGVPVEFRYLPYKRELPVRIYFKLGGTFACKLFTKNEFRFYDPSMKHYEATVLRQMDKPSHFIAYIYPAVGLKIGRRMNPRINVEINIPVMLQSDASSLYKSHAGFGMKLMVQLPVNIKTPVDRESIQ